MKESLQVQKFTLGPFETNCYFLVDHVTKEAVIIDPADDDPAIWNHCRGNGFYLKKIILTHGHYDHIAGLTRLFEQSRAEIWIHNADQKMLRQPQLNLSIFFNLPLTVSHEVNTLEDGDEIKIGCHSLHVLHTPGHTPGSICLVKRGFVISGDTLFRNSVGRTDFPGSSNSQLYHSIQKKLLALPDETTVYPGHGDNTTIGHERKRNPFLRGNQPLL